MVKALARLAPSTSGPSNQGKPGTCRICHARHSSQRLLRDCLRSHGIRLPKDTPGQPAKRKRLEQRKAQRTASAQHAASVGQSSTAQAQPQTTAAAPRAAAGASAHARSNASPRNAQDAQPASPHLRWVNEEAEATQGPAAAAAKLRDLRADVARMRQRIAACERRQIIKAASGRQQMTNAELTRERFFH